ncbi:hypothetical protein OUK_1630 [Helicobacter pylori R037c]|nr:hypothetical protein OUK_1630 [Helicobacter pylori R037c]
MAITLIFSMRFDAILKKSLGILACQWLKKGGYEWFLR